MKHFYEALTPRLLAGVGTLALLGGIGLAASHPARTAGGPVSVSVANTPLPVSGQDRDSPARQPVEKTIPINSFSANSIDNLLYTVPPGKRLIVESISFFSGLPSDTQSYTALVRNVTSANFLLTFAALNTKAGNGVFPCVTQPICLHVEPGNKLLVNVYSSGNASLGNTSVSLSGYLVDVP